MDATGVVLRHPLRFSSSSFHSRKSTNFPTYLRVKPWRPASFHDQGHVKYYDPAPAGTIFEKKKNKKKTVTEDKAAKKLRKKQLKLLKGLSTLSNMDFGFGLDSDGALVSQVKGNMIAEASQLLLQQLQKLKAEEKERKRKMKEEKAILRAARIQNRAAAGCEMSSSSSSETSSSDTECEQGINVISLNRKRQVQNMSPQAIEQPAEGQIPISPVMLAESKASGDSKLGREDSVFSKKIEVCMGGKCKKLGGGALLEEFERVVGVQGAAVSGCKCMGKCRVGPNIKVSGGKGDSTNWLSIGLEDVDVIVANLLDENGHHNRLRFAPVS